MYYHYRLLGENLCDHLGDEVYSIAFTSLNQSIENYCPPGKLETEISNLTDNSPYAFIDFETLRFQSGYRDTSFETSVIRKKKINKTKNCLKTYVLRQPLLVVLM